jgi:predicted  nucleic acid-binding Zn-ribbon protein
MAVTASAHEQAELLALQALDTKLLQLAHKRANIAQIVEVQDLEVAVGSLDMRIVAATTEASDIELAVRKAEADVDQVVQHALKDQQRLDSGAVSSSKDLESLQHEITSLAARQSELEEVELELMERLEETREVVGQLKAEQAQAIESMASATALRDEQMAEIDAEVVTIKAERETHAAPLPQELLDLYNKIRVDFGGIGAALLQRGACQGCRIAMDMTELDRIRNTPAETVVRCDGCRRILVRTAESGL